MDDDLAQLQGLGKAHDHARKMSRGIHLKLSGRYRIA